MHRSLLQRVARASVLVTGLLASWPALACDPAPTPVVDIVANGYYTDSAASIIDPVKLAQDRAAAKPLEDFLRQVANRASLYAADPGKHRADADCALQWLATWAGGNAMLGTLSSEQAYYHRKWTLSGLAFSYARVRPLATTSQKAGIDAWLRQIADRTIAHSDQHKGVRNNHYYWEGVAVGAVGALLAERRYRDWALHVLAKGLADIAPDGSLPLELKRGRRALHYHLFAAEPLVMLASVLDQRSPRLDALVTYCVAQVADPADIARAAGVAQELPVRDNELAWLAIYLRRESSPAAFALLASRGRAPASRLGGDLSLANPLEHGAR